MGWRWVEGIFGERESEQMMNGLGLRMCGCVCVCGGGGGGGEGGREGEK